MVLLQQVVFATFDTARTVQIDSTNAGDTSQTALVVGTDINGLPVSELIAFNGTTAVSGNKAFLTVTRVTISAALAGNATVGNTTLIGLPYLLTDTNRLEVRFGGSVDTATAVVGDGATATTTTGDVRGVINPNGTLDGTTRLAVIQYVDRSSSEAAHGVAQA